MRLSICGGLLVTSAAAACSGLRARRAACSGVSVLFFVSSFLSDSCVDGCADSCCSCCQCRRCRPWCGRGRRGRGGCGVWPGRRGCKPGFRWVCVPGWAWWGRVVDRCAGRVASVMAESCSCRVCCRGSCHDSSRWESAAVAGVAAAVVAAVLTCAVSCTNVGRVRLPSPESLCHRVPTGELCPAHDRRRPRPAGLGRFVLPSWCALEDAREVVTRGP